MYCYLIVYWNKILGWETLGAFLDGAEDGIMAYIIKWDSTVLSDPYIWSEAIGQVWNFQEFCPYTLLDYVPNMNVSMLVDSNYTVVIE